MGELLRPFFALTVLLANCLETLLASSPDRRVFCRGGF